MSTLDMARSMLEVLSDDELNAVQSIMQVIISKKSAEDSFFQPQTEEQLLQRIDSSIAQGQRGLYKPAEAVEEEIRATYGI